MTFLSSANEKKAFSVSNQYLDKEEHHAHPLSNYWLMAKVAATISCGMGMSHLQDFQSFTTVHLNVI